MSIAGYFGSGKPEEAEKKTGEPPAEEYYDGVEDYDPVPRAHCRL